jgi:2-polyprenyl-6-methoxyphenol hydroxylase-like FAD-dependent oxidoreductase
MNAVASNDTPAIIIGGGIAGPVMGLALHRAGIPAVVYEASVAPRDTAGAFLNLAPNGIEALRALGLEALTDTVGFRNDRLVFQTDSGRTLAEVPVGGVTLMRGAFARVLREAAIRAGVRFEFGKQLDVVEQNEYGAAARFADGTTAWGSMLIGADGLHSRTRASALPESPAPAYTGILNLGGIVHTDLPPTGRTMHMIFGRRAFFGYAVRPSGDTYWFSNFTETEAPARETLIAIGAERFKSQLLALHRDDPAPVRTILQSLTGEIGAYAVYDIPSLPRWHRGRVCLIGDAAHAVGPHVGQGTSLAIEDAFVLARCVRDVGNPATAFATFERLRRDRVERVVRQSRRTGARKAPTGWLGRKIRDLILPLFLRKGAEGAAWLYASRFDWDERVPAMST